MTDPTQTRHTPGYPRPYVAYPYAVPMREDLAGAGRTVTVERLGKDAPKAYLARRGFVAIIERVNGLMTGVCAVESEVAGGLDGIAAAARQYAEELPARYLPLTEPVADESAPCPVEWCASGPHAEGTTHYAPVIDFSMKGAVEVSIDIADHERSGRRVLVSLHNGPSDPVGEHLELSPVTAYVVAQIIAAMDSALVLQFAERLASAAVTLDPAVAEVRK